MQREAVDERWVELARRVAREVLAPGAAQVDQARCFPSASFEALARAGLLGLLVPREHGGGGASYSTLVRVLEPLGAACGSSAMCFLMHSCGAAILAAGVRGEQVDAWLRPIARGERIVALAQSEQATGGLFYAPTMQTVFDDDHIVLAGSKSFVTSAGHADLYLVLTRASTGAGLSMQVVERDRAGLGFDGEWDGMGMAGTSSVTMHLRDVRVPRANLIASDGVAQDLLFGVNASVFLLGLAAIHTGIAQAALDWAIERARSPHPSSGDRPLAAHQAIRLYLAEMQMAVRAARHEVHAAAADQDGGTPSAQLSRFASKIAAAEASAVVTDRAMQIGGGQAYRRRYPAERLYRDARSAALMSPTTEVLKDWIGRTLVGMPLFDRTR